MRWDDIGLQVCSVARALSVVGERWTLLILRDAFLGTRRFDQFQKRLGITRHRLSERLGKLVDVGRRSSYALQRLRSAAIVAPRTALVGSAAVNLHPVAIIVAVVFFGSLWGVWGVFFAIPLATFAKALLNALLEFREQDGAAPE